MQRAQTAAHLFAEDLHQRQRLRRGDRDLEATVTQAGRGLEPDETGAHHDHPARRCQGLYDGLAVAPGAQGEHARQVAARSGQLPGHAAGGDEQSVGGQLLATVQDHPTSGHVYLVHDR